MALSTPLRPLQTVPAPAPAPPAPPVVPRPAPPEADLGEYDGRLDLTDEERRRLGAEIARKVRLAQTELQERFNLVRLWREQYDAKSYPKETPWPNAASLNVPTTRRIVDTIHAELYQAITGVQPLFQFEAYRTEDQEIANAEEQVVEWQLTQQADFRAFVDESLHGGLIDANRIAKVVWRREAHRVRRPGAHPETGERVLIEETDYTINQPEVVSINVLDFVLYPHDSLSVEAAIGVGHRVWKTANDLLRGARDGFYDEAAVDDLLGPRPDRADDTGQRLRPGRGAQQPDRHTEMYGGDATRDAHSGISSSHVYDGQDRPYECFEVVWLYDADGDGIQEDCLFVVEMDSGTLLRAEVYPYWHNERNYINVCPIPRDDSFWGYSVPEMLESLHAEINAIRNQRVDAGTLYLSPMLAVRRGTKFDFNKQRWRPGGVLWLDDPVNDIRPVSFQNVAQTAFSEEQFAREQAEGVTGASDYAQGQSPSRSRTLGEVGAVLQSGNKRFALIVDRLQRANNRIAYQVIGLNAQYLDPRTEAALTQAPERVFGGLTRADLRTRVKIAAQGNTINSNKELQLQMWETLYQMMQNEPLMQPPTHRYAVVGGYLQAMGRNNLVPYIGSEAEAKAAQEQAQAAGPPPPPPPQLSGKLDEVMTLALMLKEGQINVQQLVQSAELVQQWNLTQQTVASVGAAADAHTQGQVARQNAAHQAGLDQQGAAHAATLATAHGLVQGAAQQDIAAAAAPPPAPPYPQNGGNAAPPNGPQDNSGGPQGG